MEPRRSLPLPTPKYILDYQNWTIHLYDDVKEDVTSNGGYGIISYTWGRWQDRDKAAPDGPAFSERIPVTDRWDIPVMKTDKDTGKEVFTMAEIKNALGQLRMKYVWWDWACIPQRWTGIVATTTEKTQQQVGDITDPRATTKTEEVNKQVFIYTQATKGIIWVHDTVWTEKENPMVAFVKWSPPPADGTISRDILAGEKFVATLEALVERENWFSSMWTFQEGLLLSSCDMIDPRDGSMIVARSGLPPFVDHLGMTRDWHDLELSTLHLAGPVWYRHNMLSELLKTKMRLLVDTRDGNWHEQVKTLTELLVRIRSTGLVSYHPSSDSPKGPIGLLEASKARGDLGHVSEADYCVNAVLGAVAVQLSETDSDHIDSLKRGFMHSLVERYQWGMLLVVKHAGGVIGSEPTNGFGHWLSILGMTWNFCALETWIITSLAVRVDNGRFFSTVLEPGPEPGPQDFFPGQESRERIRLPTLTFNADTDSHAIVMGSEDVMGSVALTSLTGWDQCVFYGYKVTPKGSPKESERRRSETPEGSRKGSERRRSEIYIDYKVINFDEADEELGSNLAFVLLETFTNGPQDISIRSAGLHRFLVLKDFVAEGTETAGGVFVGIVDVQNPQEPARDVEKPKEPGDVQKSKKKARVPAKVNELWMY